ncbi:hypothetical protein RND71_002049 [Anisodus tanguticus]|uniref:Importin N-terminal domain-containing protein n=1 Tax=Anisodus tanguticus TaxID=243964 RepID=A0AAE1T1X9_9SOLA|nr:hypothetical protein RND71_002049 [Anisodus tanguticus]
MESLAHLEALCERLYNSQDSAERAHAENTLKCFSVYSSYISQCQYILDNASTPYALMLASSSLLKQVTEQRLSLQIRLDIRNYLINYLATRGIDLEPFVTASLIQLFCRVTKYGWFEDDIFREVVKESTSILNQLILLAVNSVLSDSWLVQEVMSSSRGNSLLQKCETASRYAIGLKILNQLVSEMNQPSPGLPSAQHRRVACSFRDKSLLQVFQISLTSMAQLKNDVTVSENAYSSKLQELALALSLKCLSFDFMGTTVDESSDDFNTIQIPSSWKQVLEDQSTVQIFFDYYEINKPNISKEALECLVRLASVRRSLFTNDPSRVKYLAHLMTGTKDIMQTGKGLAHHDNYHEFCRLLGRFKVNYQEVMGSSRGNSLLQKCKLSELVNVESYGDWIRLVAEFTLRSLQSWQWASSSVYYLLGLWSRLVSSVPYLKGDTPSLLSEFVPEIVKSFITSRFGSFQGEVSDVSENPLDNVELLQDQLDCLPYLCRFQYESCSSYIMQITDPLLQMYMESADPQVLTAVETKFAWIVHIIAAIVKTKQLSGYSGESQEIQDAELSARVLRLINVTDSGLRSQRHAETSKQRLDLAILVFFQNFRKSYVGDQAIHSSKQLYARLAELLGLHDHMLILNVIVGKIATNLKFYREIYDCKTSCKVGYYSINNLPSEQGRIPIFGGLQVLLSLELIPDALFRTDDVKQALIGLMRDLRGIAMATSSQRTYGFLFDWLYPSHIPLLLKAITIWADIPEASCMLLACKTNLLLTARFMPRRRVSELTACALALAGNYVNFGVFEIYGDRALADAFDIAMRMALSIPLADILAYRKLSGAYFTFLEIMMKNQIQVMLNLDSSSFTFIAGSLESGLKVLDANIKSQCASAVDNLATFYFEHITAGESPTTPVALNLAQHLADCPNIFLEMFSNLRAQILSSQPADQQQRLSLCFDKLMADITRSLNQKNRDKFSNNLTSLTTGDLTFAVRNAKVHQYFLIGEFVDDCRSRVRL